MTNAVEDDVSLGRTLAVTSNIAAFIDAGGAYSGTCAGAYYAAPD